MVKRTNPFLGKWQILEMEMWDRDYIDLIVPGHITFEDEGDGSFQFGTVKGWLDCRIEGAGDERRIEFSWEGFSDTDPGCGRGWAIIRDDELHRRLYIHAGDDSSFRARRSEKRRRKNVA
jgi:hypothetical protein